MTPDGKLMSIPISAATSRCSIYRGDLYKENGPEGRRRPSPSSRPTPRRCTIRREMYGIVQRGARGPHTVAYDFYPYLYGIGGGLFKDQNGGDYSVTLNSAEGKEALDYYIRLAKEAGHPKTASHRPGRGHPGDGHRARPRTSCIVIAAWSQMDDPNKSVVVDKIEFAPPPSAPGLPTAPGARPLARRHLAQRAGRPQGGGGRVPALVPDQGRAARQRQGRRHPAQRRGLRRADRRGAPLPLDEAAAEALPHAVNIYHSPRRPRSSPCSSSASTGPSPARSPSADALNAMADEIHEVMEKSRLQDRRAAAARRRDAAGGSSAPRCPRARRAAVARRQAWRRTTIGSGAG